MLLLVAVYPLTRTAETYRGPRDIASDVLGKRIDFGPVFRNFSLPVDDIVHGVDVIGA